ncbi:hypothetical protein [Paraburkholderia diazotrophica]|uniref:Restriction endonuclease n=1 Tax=Paraburkholderia diazotrophica TaxID=667676 RepID=A0A1H7AJK7_9BURK|nr:hypothetical protein [Paraburkholderia diazotrophica]SEJ62090.1 hypothetical protein SAMN05192539_101479 [Paraburkholderia diazotrophica]
MASEADDDEAAVVVGISDHMWLIQCKRERAIGPKKLLQYLDEIKLGENEKLHGIIFTAACDFSKAARDLFRDRCIQMGLQEWHIWGKGEVEDRLFRPENDGLLFAYFGVSLTIRRRSQRADLRSKLAMKRKANRLLGPKEHGSVLLRSPDALQYPYSAEIHNFERLPPWYVRRYVGLSHDGLKFSLHRHFAFLSDDGKSWDAMLCCHDATRLHDDPWTPEVNSPHVKRAEAWRIWNELPEQNKAWLDIEGIVPFDTVLDIDELGDECFSAPHAYVPFDGAHSKAFSRVLKAAPHSTVVASGSQTLRATRVERQSAHDGKHRDPRPDAPSRATTHIRSNAH